MKLYTVSKTGKRHVAIWSKGSFVDLAGVLEDAKRRGQTIPQIPRTLIDLLENWSYWSSRLVDVQEWADSIQIPELRYPEESVKIEAPIPRPPKIVGIAFNNRASERFLDRYSKTGNPGWFIKCSSCVVGQDDAIELVPEGWSNVTTPEIELGIVIGKKARWVSIKEAYDVIAGYTIFNDVTAQDLLVGSSAFITAERYFTRMLVPDPGQAWEKDQFSGPNRIEMKQWDTFAPMGPCMITSDEIGDPHDQKFSCRVNGLTIMEGQKLELIWDVPRAVHMVSLITTLEPGDVISSGNLGRLSPKGALKAGDSMELTISKIGTLRNKCVASKFPPVW